MEDDLLKCSICKMSFSEERLPLNLPCGDSYCKLCLQEMIKNNGYLECPQDSQKFNDQLSNLIVNKKVLSLSLKKSQRIVCNVHPNQKLRSICLKDKEFLCKECLLDHISHKGWLERFGEEKLIEAAQKQIERLQAVQETIQNFIDSLNLVIHKQINKIDEIKKLFQNTNEFLNNPINQDSKLKDYPFRLFFGDERLNFIASLFPSIPKSMNLIYKGSSDGFSSTAFHSKCDNQGPTVTIVKATNGKIFGGYSCLNWNSTTKGYIKDTSNSCFLFSVTNQKKYMIHPNQNQDAIFCHENYGPTFGGGYDLYVCSDCNTKTNSGCNFPTSYFGGEDNYTQLSGDKYFLVEDYEVFKVELNN